MRNLFYIRAIAILLITIACSFSDRCLIIHFFSLDLTYLQEFIFNGFIFNIFIYLKGYLLDLLHCFR